MGFKTIVLTYKGHGLFAAKPKLTLRKGQTIRVSLGPTPISDAMYGAMKVPKRWIERLTHDPELGQWTS